MLAKIIFILWHKSALLLGYRPFQADALRQRNLTMHKANILDCIDAIDVAWWLRENRAYD